VPCPRTGIASPIGSFSLRIWAFPHSNFAGGNLASVAGSVDIPISAARLGSYITLMRLFFFVLAVILMLATVGTLLIGVSSMGRGGEFNEKYGNKLMRLRVILQGLAIVCLMLGWISG